MLDSFDRKIVRALQRDGRRSLSDVAASVGLSTSACSRRVQRLEQDGILTGYAALVAPAALDAGTEVRVQVTLDSQTEATLRRFETAIREVSEVVSCDLMAGSVDYTVQVAVANLEAYEHLHRRVLSSLPGVARLESSFVLRSIVRRRQPTARV